MTKRQLRRLALQTTRYPSWLPVLQDALLEMFPEEFQGAIDRAKRNARGSVQSYAVLFFPHRMQGKFPKFESLSPFLVIHQDLVDEMPSFPKVHAVVAYTAPAGR